MAVEKKLQGLHIVLIVFIILSIGLCVTTVLAYKNYQEQLIEKNAAVKKENAAVAEQKRLEKMVADIKTVGGWDDNYDVGRILDEFEKDKTVFAGTYGETTQDVYPKMLRMHLTKYKAVQDQLAQELAKVAQLESEKNALKDEKDKINEQFRQEVAAITEKANARETDNASLQESKASELAKADTKYSDFARQSTESASELTEKARIADESRLRTEEQLTNTIQVTKDFRGEPLNFTAPDGKIIETSASVGVVYVNRGRDDGLRRQTIFQVFDHDAQLRDAGTLEPKGEIEITEIIGPHRAVARVIKDTVSDPILPGDLIHSFIFRPGMPERFAFAGKLDVDGDGTDDLDRLRSLVQINGAQLDAFIDSEGAIAGELSEGTRYLVVGERPRKESEEAARGSFDQIRTQASQLGVVKISLEKFLDYIGLQSDDQRYDLSHQSRDRDAIESTSPRKEGEQPFRKRPERGDDGAF